MEKNTLTQALAERNESNAAKDRERQREKEAAEQRYIALITSGSASKKDVDELLKAAALSGKSDVDMQRDIANIESAQRIIQEIEACAGLDSIGVQIAGVLDVMVGRTRDGLIALQKQKNDLIAVQTILNDRLARGRELFTEFRRFKSQHAHLLNGVEAPPASILHESADASSLPEFKEWLSRYVEVTAATYEPTGANETPRPAA